MSGFCSDICPIQNSPQQGDASPPFTFSFLKKNVNIIIHKIIISSGFCKGVELGLTQRKVGKPRIFEKGIPRKIFGHNGK
jgi:hypothetical protein